MNFEKIADAFASAGYSVEEVSNSLKEWNGCLSKYAHVEGVQSGAYGNYSHAEGVVVSCLPRDGMVESEYEGQVMIMDGTRYMYVDGEWKLIEETKRSLFGDIVAVNLTVHC